jgi:hypothetical protein
MPEEENYGEQQADRQGDPERGLCGATHRR